MPTSDRYLGRAVYSGISTATVEAGSEAHTVSDCGEVAGTTRPEPNDDHAIVGATVRP